MTAGVSLRCGVIGLACVVAAGCAEVPMHETTEKAITVEPAAVATAPLAVTDAATLEPESTALGAALAGNTENVSDEPPEASGLPPVPSLAPTEDIAPGTPDLVAVAPAAPAPREFESAPGLVPSLVASPASAETLDLSALVTRLRKTKAINLLTKFAVKNESDDLLEQFRAYHTQRGITTLADLRRSYDSLFHKLHSLLREADPPLARDIDRSRAAIWELLADPRKFTASRLMAGT
jgi:hypothetical protein